MVITILLLVILKCINIFVGLPAIISSILMLITLLFIFGIPYSLDLFIPNRVENKAAYIFFIRRFDLFPYSSPAFMYFLSPFRIIFFWAVMQTFFSDNHYLGNQLLENWDGIIELILAIIFYVVLVNVGMRRKLLNRKLQGTLNEKYKKLLKKHSDFTKATLIPITALSVIMGVTGITTKDIKSDTLRIFTKSIGITNSRQVLSIFSIGMLLSLIIITIAVSYFINKIFQYVFEYVL